MRRIAEAPGREFQLALAKALHKSLTCVVFLGPNGLGPWQKQELQIAIDKCSQAWTESGPPYTYTCGGSTSTVLASRALIGSNLTLSNLTLTAGSTDHLRVTVTFPGGAGNTLQNQSSTISYTFTGNQRAGTDQ